MKCTNPLHDTQEQLLRGVMGANEGHPFMLHFCLAAMMEWETAYVLTRLYLWYQLEIWYYLLRWGCWEYHHLDYLLQKQLFWCHNHQWRWWSSASKGSCVSTKGTVAVILPLKWLVQCLSCPVCKMLMSDICPQMGGLESMIQRKSQKEERNGWDLRTHLILAKTDWDWMQCLRPDDLLPKEGNWDII